MHPVKARAVIKTAYRVYGVRHFVVDHRDELDKVIAEVGAQGLTIMVRVNTPPADDTLYHLAAKFGAAPDDAAAQAVARRAQGEEDRRLHGRHRGSDRKSTRLNSSH